MVSWCTNNLNFRWQKYTGKTNLDIFYLLLMRNSVKGILLKHVENEVIILYYNNIYNIQ